ncbi:MAG: Rrf2 family transcriptional regulator [Cyanobacteria bacterium REEB67]|nr:Rrf2 family transcriptional regulator [Cyanobacteria bacterium REEB67]
MISQTAEYALRAMVFVAMQKAAVTGQEIAAVTKVPPGYLSKIMQQLVKGKVVNSQRGIGGGFVLSRTADKISILDVINAVDPIDRIESCPLGISSHGFNLCPLHKRLSDATAHVEAAFSQSFLSELLEEAQSPLCKSVPLTASK